MASIIRIKRSATSGNPTTLAAGELAYSSLADNFGSNVRALIPQSKKVYAGTQNIESNLVDIFHLHFYY